MIEAYWSSVGVKKKVGGFEAAWLSCLKLVSTIHATGAKKISPAAQASTVSRWPVAVPRERRGRRGAAGGVTRTASAVVALMTAPCC